MNSQDGGSLHLLETETSVSGIGDVFSELEKHRLKTLRDRKGFLFVVGLLAFLSILCLISALIGSSLIVAILAGLLALSSIATAVFRKTLGHSYEARLRSLLAKSWFRSKYPEAYLIVPDKSLSEIATGALRGACKFVTKQSVSFTEMEMNFAYDFDQVDSYVFVAREKGRFFQGSTKSRFLVWFKARKTERDAWIIDDGDTKATVKNATVQEVQMVSDLRKEIVEQARYSDPMKLGVALGLSKSVRVAFTPMGVWAAVPMSQPLFTSSLDRASADPEIYESWASMADLPLSKKIRSSVNRLASLG